MAAPRRMTSHYLNPIKGLAMDIETLDFVAKLAAAVTIDPLYSGRVVHLNDTNEYETGVPVNVDGTRAYMPLFIFQDSDSPDVKNDGGNTGSASDDPNTWIGIGPSGNIKAFVATGGTELETTEFQSEASLGSTYLPNHCLQATVANTTAATGGRVTKGTLGTNTIIGIVSRPVRRSEHGVNVLAFWPVLFPKYP